jgi:predicted methyltransferase
VGAKGSVTAWQASQFAGDPEGKAKWAGILGRTPNVKILIQPFEGFEAPANAYSFAMFHLVYHDAYWESAKYGIKKQDPDLLVKKLYTAMKPGGIVGVVDHVGTPGDPRVSVEKFHRIDPAVVKADFLRAGFKLAGESQHLRTKGDDYSKGVFDPAVRGKTDRFVFKFVKPKK